MIVTIIKYRVTPSLLLDSYTGTAVGELHSHCCWRVTQSLLLESYTDTAVIMEIGLDLEYSTRCYIAVLSNFCWYFVKSTLIR